jgi:hypothetical protein
VTLFLWILIIFFAVVVLAVVVGQPSTPKPRSERRKPTNRGGN